MYELRVTGWIAGHRQTHRLGSPVHSEQEAEHQGERWKKGAQEEGVPCQAPHGEGYNLSLFHCL